jgi:hypothetical protein
LLTLAEMMRYTRERAEHLWVQAIKDGMFNPTVIVTPSDAEGPDRYTMDVRPFFELIDMLRMQVDLQGAIESMGSGPARGGIQVLYLNLKGTPVAEIPKPSLD